MDGHNSDDWQRRHLEATRPLISFVLPVYNARPYLDKCLDSITSQTFRDIEIIAVDGASSDGSAVILDDRQRADPRLTVLHEGRIGPGNARNLGARQARGEYLWFVDGDDVIATECLVAIVHSIKISGPDVLLIDYKTNYPGGLSQSGPVQNWPDSWAGTCFTAADHPDVLDQSLASWSKVIRREFFLGSGAKFASRWPHEDVPVSCRVLLTAKKLAVLDQVCYLYQKNSIGSAMAEGAARRHFTAFDVWRPILDEAQKQLASAQPVMTADVYRKLHERAIYHYSTIFDSGGAGIGRARATGYIQPQDRREYFSGMHEDFIKYMPDNFRYPAKLRGVKFRLIKRGSYVAYSILSWFNKLRAALA